MKPGPRGTLKSGEKAPYPSPLPGRRTSPSLAMRCEGRLSFHGQLIARKMGRPEGDRLLKRRGPALVRLSGQAVNQVEADVRKAGPMAASIAACALAESCRRFRKARSLSSKDWTPRLRRFTPRDFMKARPGRVTSSGFASA